MFQSLSIRLTLSAFLLAPFGLVAENPATVNPSSTPVHAQVPRTIRISGALKELSASTVPSQETIRFTLYQDEEGTMPLWSETQQVEVAPLGRYTVLLGAGTEGGIPLPLFSSMDAHWLGVQLEGQHEQPPVMLVSVPYALKAADAETLGGWPASSFVRSEEASKGAPPAADKAGREASVSPKALGPIYGEGATGYLAKFTGRTTIGSSVLFDNGFVGVGTTSPRTNLDVNGTLTANRLTLVQDSGKTSPTWNLDNSASRFRLFIEPRFDENGTEILTANTTTGVDVMGRLNAHGNLTAISGLRTNTIEFPVPEELYYTTPYPTGWYDSYYSIESYGATLDVNFKFQTFGYPHLWRLMTLVGNPAGTRMGINTTSPRSVLDVAGGIIATNGLLLARDNSATSPAWNIVNDASLFRLAHQDSLSSNGQTVMVATENNRVGIGVDQPSHTLEVGGDVGVVGGDVEIVGAGHGVVFPDGTVQTSALPPPGALFGICISNSAGPQTCACARVLSQTQVSAGQSCSITGLPGSCTATSQGGVPVTYGTCCVCS